MKDFLCYNFNLSHNKSSGGGNVLQQVRDVRELTKEKHERIENKEQREGQRIKTNREILYDGDLLTYTLLSNTERGRFSSETSTLCVSFLC